MSFPSPMNIRYSLEKNEELKTYQVALVLPASPIWKALRKVFTEEEQPSQGGAEKTLNLFPDPQLIKQLYEEISAMEKNGYRSGPV